jgi:hypothetical protein
MLSAADVERLALELAKHSGLQEIFLEGTGCFVIAVWSGDVRGGGGGECNPAVRQEEQKNVQGAPL